MRMTAVWMAVAAAVVASGCAGPRQSQEVTRLKSDLSVLDQRISQLERESIRQSSAMAQPAAPAMSMPEMTPPAASMPAVTAPTGKPSKKEIQQALKNAGLYQGPIDGKIGPVTRDAVKEFQRANGLTVDGVVGAKTWEKLAAYLQLDSTGADASATVIK